MIFSDIVILICLIFSAFFSGMEIAFVSSNRIYLEIEKSQRSYTSRVLRNITQKPSQFIATMLLGNNIALVVYGIFAGERILQFFFSDSTLIGQDPSAYYFLGFAILSVLMALFRRHFRKKFNNRNNTS